MIRIAHTADLHLDSPFAGDTMEQRAKKREELRAALSAVCDYCIEKKVDILLVAGDLFDGKFARRETVSFVADSFARIKDTRVFVAPGNHDPYNNVSPYKYCTFPDNVHIFTSEELETVEIPELGAAVYGYGFTSDRMRTRPTEGIHPSNTDRINILVAHGDLDDPTSAYYNIRLSDISASELDYVALGHIHKPSGTFNAGNTVCAYSGCLVGRDFGECGKRGMVAGEISKGDVLLKYIHVTEMTYEEIYADVTGKDMHTILNEIAEKRGQYSEKCRVRVILSGERSGEYHSGAQLARLISEKCDIHEVSDMTGEMIIFEELVKEHSLRGLFAKQLQPMLRSDDPETSRRAELALKYGLEALKK